MDTINEIEVEKVKEAMEHNSAIIVDIRDSISFNTSRIPNAVHLSDDTVQGFVSNANKEEPVIIYCYHGISSQGAAAYFSKQGFKKVLSMTGGFEKWRTVFPDSFENG